MNSIQSNFESCPSKVIEYVSGLICYPACQAIHGNALSLQQPPKQINMLYERRNGQKTSTSYDHVCQDCQIYNLEWKWKVE